MKHRMLVRAAMLVTAALLGWLTAVALARAAEPEAVDLLETPDKLADWEAYHQEEGTNTGDVWTLKPDGVLHCEGEPLGYLYTNKDYTNFILKLEWRWPEGVEPGHGGVLIRMTGPHKVWPKSLEAQINAGDAGDFWGLGGYRLEGPEDRTKKLEHPQFGKLTNLKKKADVEKPAGEWNHYEIYAKGDTVTLTINGQQVNRATGCEVVPGKILLTAEGNPIEFRNVQVTPLD